MGWRLRLSLVGCEEYNCQPSCLQAISVLSSGHLKILVEEMSLLDNMFIEKYLPSLFPASLVSVFCPVSPFKVGKFRSSLAGLMTSVAPGSVTYALISSNGRCALGWMRVMAFLPLLVFYFCLTVGYEQAMCLSSILLPLSSYIPDTGKEAWKIMGQCNYAQLSLV